MTDVMYLTGNAVPSADGKDRHDNSIALDYAVSGDGNTFVDRKGRTRKTLKWMETAATGIPAVAAAQAAEAARDAAQLSAGVYQDTATGIAATVAGKYFSVPSAESAEYLILYKNNSGSALEIKRYPSVAAVSAVLETLGSYAQTGTEYDYLAMTSLLGDIFFRLTDTSMRTVPFDIIKNTDHTYSLGSVDGAQLWYLDDLRAIFGPAEFMPTTANGVFITDAHGGVIADLTRMSSDPVEASPLKGGILASPLIAIFSDTSAKLYPQNLLAMRERFEGVVATVSSTTTDDVSTGRSIDLTPSKIGSAAVLQIRSKTNQLEHKFMDLKIKSIATQVTPVPINVLLIGDSIGNRCGGTLIRSYLESHGYAPTFIGTFPGSSNPTNSNDANGELGEAHEGWETGDFTYAVTDRVTLVAPGTEAAYLAMSKTQKANVNAWLRASGVGDDAAVVKNGMVFDPAYYQSRFGLETPDVVVMMAGTNDARDRLSSTVYADVFENDTIMMTQIRAAWPSCKIVRCLPGTAINADRNIIWTSHYTKMIAAMQDAVRTLADPLCYIAPTWAMSDPESGYFVPFGVADQNGVTSGDWGDSIHPIASSRAALFKSVAAYVAGAATNSL